MTIVLFWFTCHTVRVLCSLVNDHWTVLVYQCSLVSDCCAVLQESLGEKTEMEPIKEESESPPLSSTALQGQDTTPAALRDSTASSPSPLTTSTASAKT